MPRQHTLIIEVPDEVTDEQLRGYGQGGIIAAELAFPAWPNGEPRDTVSVDVVEHHFERMVNDPEG